MIARLRPELCPRDVEDRLAELARSEKHRFADLGNVHFARWCVVAKESGSFLAYESNVDGELASHLHDLAAPLGTLLDDVLVHAVGYPPPGARSFDARLTFLRSILIDHEALHIGHPGIDVATIRNDVEVRRVLGRMLDEDAARGGTLRRLPPRDAHDAIVGRLRAARPDLWLGPVEDGVIRKGRYKAFAAVAMLGALLAVVLCGGEIWAGAWIVGGLVALLALALVVIVALVAVRLALPRFVASEEAATPTRARLAHPERQTPDMQRILATERSAGQNALTHLAQPKPGPFRWLLQRAVFFVVELVARIEYVEGALGNITSIHFARWMFIDDDRSILFFSNYDGTWESYLGEFTDKQATWLSAVWSNCEGFPPTEGLFRPDSGAGREEHFKLWTRDNERLTPFWYAAYPTLAVRTVLDNAIIRAALETGASAKRIASWMERV